MIKGSANLLSLPSRESVSVNRRILILLWVLTLTCFLLHRIQHPHNGAQASLYVSHFENFYLIGKILGESLPLKLIMAKCIPHLNLTREHSFVDNGNGFSLVKSTNSLDCNIILENQPSFVGGQTFNLKRWKKTSNPVKEKPNQSCFGSDSHDFHWKCGMKWFLDTRVQLVSFAR